MVKYFQMFMSSSQGASKFWYFPHSRVQSFH